MSTLAEVLYEARVAAKLSNKECAAQIGISATHLCDLESGARAVTAAMVHRMPPAIRGPCARALAAELEARAAELRRLADG